MGADALERIRSRKVVQWVLGYLAVAWLLAQALHLVGEQFEVPGALLRGTTMLLAFGVLPATVIAWYHGEKGRQRVERSEVGILAALGVVGTLLVVWAAQPATPTASIQHAAPTYDPLTVAVLPFQLLGDDAGDHHAAAGLHDEMIISLARLAGLRVISRTSVLGYQSGNRSMREVADELRVGSVVEASVQRFGDELRVRLQLIDTASDTHRWARVVHGSADNVFALQAQMALEVARALGVQPTSDELIAITEPPSSNPVALVAYNDAFRRWRDSEGSAVTVARFEEALAHDPSLHAAHGFLAGLYAFRHSFTAAETDLAAAEMHLGRIRDSAPQSAYRAVAEGMYRFYIEGDLETALIWLERARAGMPNTPFILQVTGAIQLRLHRWEDALESHRAALALDPRQRALLLSYTTMLRWLGRFDEAVAETERFAALVPGCDWCEQARLDALYQWTGDVRYLEAGLSYRNPARMVFDEIWIAVQRGELERALRLADNLSTGSPGFPTGLERALVFLWAGGPPSGHDALIAAIPSLREIGADDPATRHELASSLYVRALIVAGRCEDALQYSSERVAMRPVREDPANVHHEVVATLVQLLCGEVDAARARARVFIQRPMPAIVGAPVLLQFPGYRPLADDPVIRPMLEAARDRLPAPPPFAPAG